MILNRRADATDRLLEAAEKYRGEGAQKREVDLSWREKPVEERLIPDEPMRERLNAAIFDELCQGVFNGQTTELFIQAIDDLKSGGRT